MTPKEKAKELVLKFMHNVLDYTQTGLDPFKAKQCALIAVDEISWILNELDHHNDVESEMYFYNEVRQEIEKL